MSNERVAPINHSGGSALATTAGGTAWGGFKWGALLSLAWVVGFTALGVWLPFALGATGLLAIGLAIPSGLLGMGFGAGSVGIAAIPGTLFGAIGGGMSASNRVEREREAAARLQAEVSMANARGGYRFESGFNQAGSMIDASSAENQGRMAQLERSRAQ